MEEQDTLNWVGNSQYGQCIWHQTDMPIALRNVSAKDRADIEKSLR